MRFLVRGFSIFCVFFEGSSPSFEQPLKSEIAQLGGTVTLECVVAGEPQPNIEWLVERCRCPICISKSVDKSFLRMMNIGQL